MPWYDDIYKFGKSSASKAWKFASEPQLPKDIGLAEGGYPKKIYDAIQPMSAPINLPMAFTGARAATGVGRLIKSGGKYKGPAQEAFESAAYPAMLSSPQTPIRAALGSFAGTMVGAAQQAGKGNWSNAGGIVKDALNPVKVVKGAARGWMQPELAGKVPQTAVSDKNVLSKVLGVPTRNMSAVDYPAVDNLTKHGFGLDEAQRLTLGGTPESTAGKTFVKFFDDFPLGRAITPFARMGVHATEQSLGTKGRMLASLGVGAGAAALEDKVPVGFEPYLAAAAGPFTLPAAAGLAGKHAYDRYKNDDDKGWMDVVGATLKEGGRNLPIPAISPVEAVKNLPDMFVPNIQRDLAKVNDPYERDTKGDFFGSLKTKISGARETLPVKGSKVDVFGKSVSGRKDSKAKRFFTSEPYAADITPETPEGKEIEKYSPDLAAPSYSNKLEIKGAKVPLSPETASKYQEEQRAGLESVVRKMMDSPVYQAMSDEEKTKVHAVLKEKLIPKMRAAAKVKALQRELEEKRKKK